MFICKNKYLHLKFIKYNIKFIYRIQERLDNLNVQLQ